MHRIQSFRNTFQRIPKKQQGCSIKFPDYARENGKIRASAEGGRARVIYLRFDYELSTVEQ